MISSCLSFKEVSVHLGQAVPGVQSGSCTDFSSSLRPGARGPPVFRSPPEQSVTQSSPGLHGCSLCSLPLFSQVRRPCSCSLPEVLFVCGVVAVCAAGFSANFSEHFRSLHQEFLSWMFWLDHFCVLCGSYIQDLCCLLCSDELQMIYFFNLQLQTHVSYCLFDI